MSKLYPIYQTNPLYHLLSEKRRVATELSHQPEIAALRGMEWTKFVPRLIILAKLLPFYVDQIIAYDLHDILNETEVA